MNGETSTAYSLSFSVFFLYHSCFFTSTRCIFETRVKLDCKARVLFNYHKKKKSFIVYVIDPHKPTERSSDIFLFMEKILYNKINQRI